MNNDVQGFGNPETFHSLKHILREKKPELVFLMETRMKRAQMEKRLFQCDIVGGVSVGKSGVGGGLLLMQTNGWEVNLLSYSIGHMHVSAKTLTQN